MRRLATDFSVAKHFFDRATQRHCTYTYACTPSRSDTMLGTSPVGANYWCPLSFILSSHLTSDLRYTPPRQTVARESHRGG